MPRAVVVVLIRLGLVLAALATLASVMAPPAAAGIGARPFEVGLVHSTWLDRALIRSLDPGLVRTEFEIGTPVSRMRSTMAFFADANVRVLPLAGFQGRMPSSREARSLRRWALEFGPRGRFWAARGTGDALAIRDIELGNETSSGHQYGDSYDRPGYARRARKYGRRASQALNALRGTGVGLMAQGTDGGSGSSNWIRNLTAAAPDVSRRISAWTVHTYAPDWRAELDRTVRQLAEAGTPASVPLAITETGYSTDAGRCLSDNYGNDRCMGYDAAASALQTKVAALRARYGGRVAALFLYKERDLRRPAESRERESYFGLTRWDGSDKGRYTQAARELFAGRGAAR